MTTFYYFQTEFEERTIQQYADYIFDFFLSIKCIEKESFDRIYYINSKPRNWINIENNKENRMVLAQQLLSHLKKELKTYENILNPTVNTMIKNVCVTTFETRIAGVLTYIMFNFSKASPCNITFDVRNVNWDFNFYKSIFEIIINKINPKYAYLIPHNLMRAMNYVDLPSNTYKVGWVNYFSNKLNLNSKLQFMNQEFFHEGFLTMSIKEVFDENNPRHNDCARTMFDFFKDNNIVKESDYF